VDGAVDILGRPSSAAIPTGAGYVWALKLRRTSWIGRVSAFGTAVQNIRVCVTYRKIKKYIVCIFPLA